MQMRVLVSISVAIWLGSGAEARSHQAASGWDYPFQCCSSADCAQIEASAVREISPGFIVTVAPGQHPMWPTQRRAPLVLEVPYRKAMQSPDGLWHLCINDAGELLCFFAPGGGS
jgi:hypothetical protein